MKWLEPPIDSTEEEVGQQSLKVLGPGRGGGGGIHNIFVRCLNVFSS